MKYLVIGIQDPVVSKKNGKVYQNFYVCDCNLMDQKNTHGYPGERVFINMSDTSIDVRTGDHKFFDEVRCEEFNYFMDIEYNARGFIIGITSFDERLSN